MTDDLQGQVEKVTYFNEANGFTIAKVRALGRPEPVTVVGPLLGPAPGEVLKMQGVWVLHPRFGEQFEVETYQVVQPTTAEGVEKYLGSGLIKGFGPEMARRIVARFGAEALEIIDRTPKRLREVSGIGPKKLAMIEAAWQEQRQVREVMLFLQAHGVSTAYAVRILKAYGPRAMQVLKQNPYRLAADIHGIGFVTADRIAGKLGLSRQDPLRIEAGVQFVLDRLTEQGHVYYPQDQLIVACERLLQVSAVEVEAALAKVAARGQVVVEPPGGSGDGEPAVYPAVLHAAESGVADRLKTLLASPRAIRPIDPGRAMAWVQERLGLVLSPSQEKAVLAAAEQKVLVLTGGPGTGKTTLILAILRIFQRIGVPVLLAAPTGRAAKRMHEATGFEARTIHRLLAFNPHLGRFQKNEADPLDCDLLIVDEASMVDVTLMHNLLRALPSEATLILVGDMSQLPSVGPGSVLGDVVASGAVPVVRLTEIFRQARQSLIVVNAHRINEGQMPLMEPPGEELGDFYFIDQDDPDQVLRIIIDLARERIEKRFGLSGLDEVQVLTPMHRGVVGTTNLNKQLQAVLNPGHGGLTRGEHFFRPGDKVMQIRNNYDKEIFNGDIGRILRIDPEEREMVVDFDDRAVTFDFSELDQMVLSYAISVHKSQGSEYPAVILPLLPQHYLLLQRNLIYTAVTRARKLAVLVGSKRALAMGIRNNETRLRYTGLAQRLRAGLTGAGA